MNPKSHEAPKCQTQYSGTNFGTNFAFPQQKLKIWQFGVGVCANSLAPQLRMIFNLEVWV